MKGVGCVKSVSEKRGRENMIRERGCDNVGGGGMKREGVHKQREYKNKNG